MSHIKKWNEWFSAERDSILNRKKGTGDFRRQPGKELADQIIRMIYGSLKDAGKKAENACWN